MHAHLVVLPETLEADRLILRRWDLSHAEALADAVALSLEQLRPWMPWAQEAPTAESARSVIEQGRRRFDAGESFEYFLFEIGTGELVGAVGLHVARAADAEIGYWVRSDRHRMGYATEATGAVARAAFEHLPSVAIVEITMDQANVASGGVAAKAGFALGETVVERERAAPGETGRGLVWRLDRATWERRGR